ncbi:GTPase-activator protein [Ostertagia ostertagi]
MYLLDDSVFAREGCVFLSQTDIDLTGVYICFRPTHVLIKWLELLRPRVLGLRTGAVPVMIGLQFEPPKQSFVAVLQLHIDKYRQGTVELFEWASDALSIQQRSLLCWSIVSLLLPNRDELLQFISRLLRRVLATCSAENVMRQDSLTTTMLTQTLRIGGRSRLEEALDAVGMSNVKLLQVSRNIVGDRSLIFYDKSLQPADMDNVIEMLDKLVAPDSLVNDLLVTVARVAAERFPDEPHILRRVLSNVFILRFVNPLLISYMSGEHQSNRAIPKNVETRCCDWMAIICHLLHYAMTSREGAPQVDPILLQLVNAHKSSYS